MKSVKIERITTTKFNPQDYVLDLIYLKNQGINLFLNPSDQALLDHLTGVQNQEDFKVSSRFKGDLWSFQKRGLIGYVICISLVLELV